MKEIEGGLFIKIWSHTYVSEDKTKAEMGAEKEPVTISSLAAWIAIQAAMNMQGISVLPRGMRILKPYVPKNS